MYLFKKGSVKEVYVLKEPQGGSPGEGRFVFTDAYSVFDWGQMPQRIPEKGKALCLIGAYFFEELGKRGISTHYLGIEEDGVVKSLSELKAPTDTMAVRLVRVIEPKREGASYDYSVFKELEHNFLIPLELIYRNFLPEGSSVFKRLEAGSLSPKDLGLQDFPRPGERLPKPFLDVSTKLEATDRYISFQEAKELSGLSDEELEKVKEITFFVNGLITEKVSAKGLQHEDGKVEFAFGEGRTLMVVDVVGTPDECRFTFEGMPLSKELLRILYRRTDWYKQIEEAKRADPVNWKQRVEPPPPLPWEAIGLVSDLYKALANEITGREWFKAPSLKQVLERLKELLEG